jgi:hypothetical protein
VKDLNLVRDRDARSFAIIAGTNADIGNALKGKEFEKTANIMCSLIERMGFLKTAILDVAETDNLYATYVLHRVFLEHTLKVCALFLKATEANTEDFTEQYLKLRLVETFKDLKARVEAGLDIGGEPKTVLDQRFPEAQSLSDKEVRKLSEPFHLDAIIKVIRDLINAQPPDFLSKVIPTYGELSGFVHGGPTASDVLEQFQDQATRQKEVLRTADLTVSMLYSAERWLLELASSVSAVFDQTRDNLNNAMQRERERENGIHQ